MKTLGTTIYDSLNSDPDGFLRGYDGDAGALAQSLKTSFDELQANNSASIKVLGASSDYDIFPLLKAPFISQKNILITKKYASLEAGNTLVA